MTIDMKEDIFERARRVLGLEGMGRLREARVILFGTGGVGSWCAESLVRSGVGHITIVDGDVVCASNVNRQLMATTQTIGQVKVEAMRRHLLEINPDCDVVARHEVYGAETADSFDLESYDCIIDCIDSLADKMLLIERSTASGRKFFSSMGAALKLDASRIKVAEFGRVQGCPLARALRQRFKREGRWPQRKFQCVYSDEPAVRKPQPGEPNGSLVHITSIFGNMLAGMALRHLIDAADVC